LTDVAPHHATLVPFVSDLLRHGAGGELLLIDVVSGMTVARRSVAPFRRKAAQFAAAGARPQVTTVHNGCVRPEGQKDVSGSRWSGSEHREPMTPSTQQWGADNGEDRNLGRVRASVLDEFAPLEPSSIPPEGERQGQAAIVAVGAGIAD